MPSFLSSIFSKPTHIRSVSDLESYIASHFPAHFDHKKIFNATLNHLREQRANPRSEPTALPVPSFESLISPPTEPLLETFYPPQLTEYITELNRRIAERHLETPITWLTTFVTLCLENHSLLPPHPYDSVAGIDITPYHRARFPAICDPWRIVAQGGSEESLLTRETVSERCVAAYGASPAVQSEATLLMEDAFDVVDEKVGEMTEERERIARKGYKQEYQGYMKKMREWRRCRDETFPKMLKRAEGWDVLGVADGENA